MIGHGNGFVAVFHGFGSIGEFGFQPGPFFAHKHEQRQVLGNADLHHLGFGRLAVHDEWLCFVDSHQESRFFKSWASRRGRRSNKTQMGRNR